MKTRAKTSSSDAGFFVYILLNDAGITYTGIAKDVNARLTQHNANSGARFTRGRGPWRVAHMEGPLSHSDALRREMTIKKDRQLKAAIKAGHRKKNPPLSR